MLDAAAAERAAAAAAAADLPRVLFVCKGSATDGLGHVMRTRTVARAIGSRAQARIVAIGGDAVQTLLEESGVPYTVVANATEAAAVASGFDPDVVVFDLLRLGAADLAAIAGSAITVSLSPIFDRLAEVDVVFHRTAVPDPAWAGLDPQPEFRMGLPYAVIDPECHRIPSRVFRETLERRRLSVAISMGGADAANKTLQIINTLRESSSRLLLWVLLGEGYTHSYQDLVDSARGARHEIILAKTNESMWHILGTCGLSVLAGGTTTYQAAYAGLPSLNFLESADRSYLVRELVDAGVCLSAGDGSGSAFDQLNAAVERLDHNRAELLAMHRKAHGLIDGHGAVRIAEEIAALGVTKASEG